MALTLENMTDECKTTVTRLVKDSFSEYCAPLLDSGRTFDFPTIKMPHRVYAVQYDELRKRFDKKETPLSLEQSVLLRCLLFESERMVLGTVDFELDDDQPFEVNGYTVGDESRIVDAYHYAQDLPEVKEGEYLLGCLEVRPLHQSSLWLRNAKPGKTRGDLIVPFLAGSASEDSRPYQSLTIDEYMDRLRDAEKDLTEAWSSFSVGATR